MTLQYRIVTLYVKYNILSSFYPYKIYSSLMDLWIIAIVKKLFWRVTKYVMLLIVFWLILNRWFLVFFGKRVWTYNRPWGAFQELLFAWWISLLLFIILPVFYFLLFKWRYFESIVWLVWHEYRDEVVHGMVKHSSHMIIKHYGEMKWDISALHTKMTWRFDDVPFWSKLVVNYLKKKLPIVDKLIEVVAWLDQSAFANEETLQKSIRGEIDPYLKRTDVETTWWLMRVMRIVIANILLLVWLYFILFYV